MKFLKDVLICLVGLVLFISTLVTVFATIGYFQGANSSDTLMLLRLSVPVMVVTLAIAWWKRRVVWAMLGWMLPF